MANERELLQGLFSNTLKVTPEQINELLYQQVTGEDGQEQLVLKEDAAEVATSLFSKKFKELKDKATEQYNNGEKKARAEVLSSFESSLREEFGIEETDVQGIDLVKKIVQSRTGDSKLDDDKVKVHPAYIALEKRREKEMNDLKQTYEGKIQELQTGFQRKATLERIKDDVKRRLATMNPIISKNPTVATNRERDFLSKFESFDFQIQDDGDHIILKEGKRLTDEFDNPIKFEDLVKTQASLYYEFGEQNPKGNAGNGGSNNGGAPAVVRKPKDDDEYIEMMANAKTIDEEKAIYKAYYGKEIGS